jgi:hypothetical protein
MTIQALGRRICQWVVGGFVILYLVALGLFVIGHFGLFGSPSGPLAGVFLVPLGAPWNFLWDSASMNDFGRFWLGILAPMVNLVIIVAICRLLQRY